MFNSYVKFPEGTVGIFFGYNNGITMVLMQGTWYNNGITVGVISWYKYSNGIIWLIHPL